MGCLFLPTKWAKVRDCDASAEEGSRKTTFQQLVGRVQVCIISLERSLSICIKSLYERMDTYWPSNAPATCDLALREGTRSPLAIPSGTWDWFFLLTVQQRPISPKVPETGQQAQHRQHLDGQCRPSPSPRSLTERHLISFGQGRHRHPLHLPSGTSPGLSLPQSQGPTDPTISSKKRMFFHPPPHSSWPTPGH